MKIIPVKPTTTQKAAEPSRLTMGFKIPSRRTLAYKVHPSRRAMGFKIP